MASLESLYDPINLFSEIRALTAKSSNEEKQLTEDDVHAQNELEDMWLKMFQTDQYKQLRARSVKIADQYRKKGGTLAQDIKQFDFKAISFYCININRLKLSLGTS